MPRAKVQMKKIENPTNRQVTYSKRKIGLLKKAYEISTLTGIDIALIMFSPTGRLNYFSNRKRVEEVFIRYINMPEEETNGAIQDLEFLCRNFQKLMSETDLSSFSSSEEGIKETERTERLQKEILELHHEISLKESRLRFFEPDTSKMTSLMEMETYEKFLIDFIAHYERKLIQMETQNTLAFSSWDNQQNRWLHQNSQLGAPLSHGSWLMSSLLNKTIGMPDPFVQPITSCAASYPMEQQLDHAPPLMQLPFDQFGNGRVFSAMSSFASCFYQQGSSAPARFSTSALGPGLFPRLSTSDIMKKEEQQKAPAPLAAADPNQQEGMMIGMNPLNIKLNESANGLSFPDYKAE